jgi:EAL domain-containing protein (putative c-di-GMP-specific phosphodiesterase class I)
MADEAGAPIGAPAFFVLVWGCEKLLSDAQQAMKDVLTRRFGVAIVSKYFLSPRFTPMIVDAMEVRKALQEDRVVPVFQPLVNLREGIVGGFEVLARWDHTDHGLILPQNFIEVAEREGLIDGLTEQVLRRALGAAAQFREPPRLSVNISPLQLKNERLPATLRAIAEEAGYPVERLTIEITETALLEDVELARTRAKSIKDLGCRLSLDDFGTGYSSLHHLRSLPFDEMKIDRSFVASMAEERENRKIVAATIALGRSLGLTVVGEGIETEQNARVLTWLGCELGQGWLFGRPAPAHELGAMLTRPAVPGQELFAVNGAEAARCSLEALPDRQVALLQAIYDGVPAYICLLDRELRYVSLNLRLAALNGRSVEEHLGRRVKDLLRALAGESIADVEVFRSGSHQGRRDKRLLASYQPMQDEAGEVTGVLVAMLDNTARHQAETALRRRVFAGPTLRQYGPAA